MTDQLNYELFIDLIEERVCIWDLFNDDYKDKQKREKAWIEIGEEVIENFRNQSEREKNNTCK